MNITKNTTPLTRVIKRQNPPRVASPTIYAPCASSLLHPTGTKLSIFFLFLHSIRVRRQAERKSLGFCTRAMSSREAKEARAEAAARKAADEIRESRMMGEEDRAKNAADTQQQQKGVLVTLQEGTKSIIKSVQDQYEHAKEAAAGKTQEVGEKSRETGEAAGEKTRGASEAAAEKAREAKETAAGKVGEYTEAAKEKAREAKDAAAEKTGEYKESAAEKAEGGQETMVGKMAEYKDSAVDTAKRAMGYLSGKKEEAKEQTAETEEQAKEKCKETEESARQKMEELRLREKEEADEAKERAKAGEEAAKDRETAAKSSLFGPIGSVTGAIKEKLAGTKEAAEEQKQQHGNFKVVEKGDEGKVKELIVEGTEEGDPAGVMKASEQMAGQTFNDVGKAGGEGKGGVDRHGKM